MTTPSRRGVAAFLVVGALASVLTLTRIADDDVFWHLATGRWIVEHGSVPSRDVFSIATEGAPWIPFEWGWDVTAYAVERAAGLAGVELLVTATWVAIGALLLGVMRRLGVSDAAAALTLGLALLAAHARMTPRPEAATALGLAVVVAILWRARSGPEGSAGRRLWLLPPVFLVWANLHPGVLSGFVLLGIFAAAEAVRAARASGAPSVPWRTTAAVLAACGLAVLVNPHGWSTFVYVARHTRMETLRSIEEWLPTLSFPRLATIRVYEGLAIAGAASMFASVRRKDPFPAFVYAGFGLLSLRAIRFVPDFAVVSAVGTALGLDEILRVSPGAATRALRGPKAAAAALAVVAAIVPDDAAFAGLRFNRRFGLGVDDTRFSRGVVEFLRAHDVRGRPFNQFEFGGRLLWEFPGQKDFIDSRNVDDAGVAEYVSIMSMSEGFERKLERHGIDFVVLNSQEFSMGADALDRTIAPYLSGRSDVWKLVYWDDRSFLYLKAVPAFADVIAKYEYRVLQPYVFARDPAAFDALRKADPAAFRAECARKDREEPDGVIYRFIAKRATGEGP